MEYRQGAAHGHYSFMLASRITLPHFLVSSAMCLPNSAGELGNTELLNSASRAFVWGSARIALVSLLSLSMISGDVFLGAAMPCQPLASYPGTNSPTVGISGNRSRRVAEVTANGRNWPALMYPIEEGSRSNITWTCPPIRSGIAGPIPR